MLVFVYGTLKKGGRLNRHLSSSTFICHTQTSDAEFDLIGGSNFPFMIRTSSAPCRVNGDLYDVDEHTLKRLDDVEGYTEGSDDNFYTRDTILVRNGDADEQAFTYLMAEDEVNLGNMRGITYNRYDNSKEWREP